MSSELPSQFELFQQRDEDSLAHSVRLNGESMNVDEAVVLRTYTSEAVAIIASSRLGFEGIQADIQKDDCGGAFPSLQMSRGVRLLVKPEDLEDAEKILNEMEAEESRKVE